MRRISGSLGWVVSAICALILPTSIHAQGTFQAPREAPQLLVQLAASDSFGLTAEHALARFKGDPNIPENASLHALAGGPSDVRFLIGNRRASEALRSLSVDDPSVELHRWLVLEYPTVQASRAALKLILKNPTIFTKAQQTYFANPFSVTPADPLYSYAAAVRNSNPPTAGTSSAAAYTLLGLPSAWDNVQGTAYVSVVDNGIDASIVNGALLVHPDLAANLRPHFSRNTADATAPAAIDEATTSWRGHGTHVAGVVAAKPNNNEGTSGVCWSCSLMVMKFTNPDISSTCQAAVDAINEAVNNGAQVINLSLGLTNTCPVGTARDLANAAIALAATHQVSIAAASGNVGQGATTQYPASAAYPISVGATSASGAWMNFSLTGKVDFAAPGDKTFSTFYHGFDWNPSNLAGPGTSCVNQGGALDRYGYCTGTSMATPMMTGVVAVVRSANPLLSDAQVKSALAARANPFSAAFNSVGSGVPNVGQTVQDVLYGGGGNNGVTPLFVMYSSGLTNYFYTSVPQMASAATWGTMRHGAAGNTYTATNQPYVPASAWGSTVSGYGAFPGANSSLSPVAAVNVFSTANRLGQALVPLYRLSWSNASGSVNHAYTTDAAGISSFQGVGFVLDGIEGYIYPSSITQPAGTIKLYRKYNAQLDRYALFPEAQYNSFVSQGFTGTVGGTEWIGYVCPNPLPNTGVCTASSGSLPVITTANGTTFQVGIASSFGVSGTGTPTPSFALSGSLPSGVAFTPGTGSGMISGTAATGTAGAYPVTITATNSVGTATQNFTLTVVQASPTTLAVVDGTPQSAIINAAFSLPLRAIVKDQWGNPLPGVSVNFTAPGSGASAVLSAGSAVTNASGVASITATANGTGGGYSVTASVNGIATTVSFALTNIVASLNVLDGAGQSTAVNTAFAQPLRAIVKDQAGNPLAGISVSFVAPGSGASAALSASSATTNASGIASVTATANATSGGYNVMASVSGITGVVSFGLTNQPLAATTLAVFDGSGQSTSLNTAFGQPLRVIVKDQNGNPFAGASVAFAAPGSGASASLSASSAVTGANGIASVTATANGSAGPYSVTASVTGLSTVSFALTNQSFGFVNGSFELPATSWVGGMPTGWTGATGTLANAYLTAVNAGPAPDQQQVAYGGSFSQTLSLPAGFYTVTFNTRVQPNYPSGQISFRVNGVENFAVPSGDSWVLSTVPIAVASNGLYTFEWAGSGFLLDDVKITAAAAQTDFVNGSFELPATSWVGGPPTGWTGATGTVANAYLTAVNAGPAPDQQQVAYGGSFSQTLRLSPGYYTVTFNTRLQPNSSTGQISFRVNGVEKFTLPADNSWVPSTVTIAASTLGFYTFQWIGPGILLDNVRITAN